MIVNRGPQLVHVTNGCRWRRLPGVVSSRTQSGQVATSAETRVRPAPVLDSRISKPVPPIGVIASAGDRPHVGEGGRVGAGPSYEGSERVGRALDLGEHAVEGVGGPAAEAELVGEGVDKRSEPDTLDQAGDGHAQAASAGACPARRHAAPFLRAHVVGRPVGASRESGSRRPG